MLNGNSNKPWSGVYIRRSVDVVERSQILTDPAIKIVNTMYGCNSGFTIFQIDPAGRFCWRVPRETNQTVKSQRQGIIKYTYGNQTNNFT